MPHPHSFFFLLIPKSEKRKVITRKRKRCFLLFSFRESTPSITPLRLVLRRFGVCLPRQQAKPSWICRVSSEISVPENLLHHYTHAVVAKQCCSAVAQAIDAGGHCVAVFCRFHKPQEYKFFLKSCQVILGDNDVGTLRELLIFLFVSFSEAGEHLVDGKYNTRKVLSRNQILSSTGSRNLDSSSEILSCARKIATRGFRLKPGMSK